MAKVKWKQTKFLTESDVNHLRDEFKDHYYIILSRRSNYLSTFFIGLGTFLVTGKWGRYTHALMNLEDVVHSDSDYRFIEATGEGTHYEGLAGVLSEVDAVALLLPKNVTKEEWTECLDNAKTYLGTPYDNLFNVYQSNEINCCELVRVALQALPDYSTRFAKFEEMIVNSGKKLTPQMYLECEDFEIVWHSGQ